MISSSGTTAAILAFGRMVARSLVTKETSASGSTASGLLGSSAAACAGERRKHGAADESCAAEARQDGAAEPLYGDTAAIDHRSLGAINGKRRLVTEIDDPGLAPVAAPA